VLLLSSRLSVGGPSIERKLLNFLVSVIHSMRNDDVAERCSAQNGDGIIARVLVKITDSSINFAEYRCCE